MATSEPELARERRQAADEVSAKLLHDFDQHSQWTEDELITWISAAHSVVNPSSELQATLTRCKAAESWLSEARKVANDLGKTWQDAIPSPLALRWQQVLSRLDELSVDPRVADYVTLREDTISAARNTATSLLEKHRLGVRMARRRGATRLYEDISVITTGARQASVQVLRAWTPTSSVRVSRTNRAVLGDTGVTILHPVSTPWPPADLRVAARCDPLSMVYLQMTLLLEHLLPLRSPVRADAVQPVRSSKPVVVREAKTAQAVPSPEVDAIWPAVEMVLSQQPGPGLEPHTIAEWFGIASRPIHDPRLAQVREAAFRGAEANLAECRSEWGTIRYLKSADGLSRLSSLKSRLEALNAVPELKKLNIEPFLQNVNRRVEALSSSIKPKTEKK